MKINEEGISELRFDVKDDILYERFGIQYNYGYGRLCYEGLPTIIDFANEHELQNTIKLLMNLYNKVVEERTDRLKLSQPFDCELSLEEGLNKFFYEIDNGMYCERK